LNARSIALISTFAALAIALNTIRIPSIFWPGFAYSFCEIPVLVAFLIFGFKIGFLVEALHIAGQEIFFPAGPAGIVVYPMGLIFVPLMFSGVYLASKFLARRAASGKQISEKKRALYFTGFATVLRGGIMPIIDYTIMYGILLPLVLSITIPAAHIAALVPSFVVYNITNALYVVPVAYLVAKRVSKYLKMETSIPL
jgi:riboflavin transporter FmnP